MKSKKLSVILVNFLAFVLIFTFSACGLSSQQSPSTTNISSTTGTSSTGTDKTPAEVNYDPFGKYDPAIVLTTGSVGVGSEDKLPEGQTPENNVWTQAYADKLGINLKFEFTVPLDNADQKVDMVIASGAIPDVLAVTLTQFNQLLQAGQLADLTDSYNNYGSPLLKERLNYDQGRALGVLASDGKIYGLPAASDSRTGASMLWIRTDWLKKLNLAEPKTMQEILKIAEAFALQDPDGNGKKDTYGFGICKEFIAGGFSIGGLFNGYHAFLPIISATWDITWLEDENKNLISGLIQPEIKAPLLVLQDFYKRGIIDKEFAVKDGSKLQEELNSNKIGMQFGGLWDGAMVQALKEKQPEIEWKPFPIPSIDSNPALIPIKRVAMNKVYIARKGIEHPEAYIKAANLTTELQYGANVDIEKFTTGPNNEPIWRCALMGPASVSPSFPQYLHIKDALATNDSSKLAKAELKVYNDILAYRKGDMTKYSAEAYDGPNSGLAMTENYSNSNSFFYSAFYGTPTPAMGEKSDTIVAKFQETVIRIIMGADISELDKFNEYWNTQGGKEMTQEANDWYKSLKK